MFKSTKVFSSFSVDDLQKTKKFYSDTLGIEVTDDSEMGFLMLNIGDIKIMVYPKENHVPATFTILNFPVSDVEKTVDELVAKGVKFEKYDGFNQDEKGISRDMGSVIAWFKDPAGNILSVMEEK